MVYVGDAVGQPDAYRLKGVVGCAVRVVQYAHSRLITEVKSPAVTLDAVHNSKALLVVVKAAGAKLAQRTLAGVSEGRVTEVVTEGYRLRQILVELQRPCKRSGKSADLQRVRQSRAVVVALRTEEHLRLVLQAAKRLAVRDAVNVPLKAGAYAAFGFVHRPACRIDRQ